MTCTWAAKALRQLLYFLALLGLKAHRYPRAITAVLYHPVRTWAARSSCCWTGAIQVLNSSYCDASYFSNEKKSWAPLSFPFLELCCNLHSCKTTADTPPHSAVTGVSSKNTTEFLDYLSQYTLLPSAHKACNLASKSQNTIRNLSWLKIFFA